MESIDKCLNIIKATFEVRNSKDSTSRYYADLEAFRRGSMCDTEPQFGTPTNKVLIHLFAIACNDYLVAANLPPISGPIWNLDYSVTLGFLSMANSADNFVNKVRLNETLVRYEYAGAINYAGIDLLPDGEVLSVYRKSSSELTILFDNVRNGMQSLLSWNGTSGWLRYFPVNFMFVSSPAVAAGAGGANAHVVSCDNTASYALHVCSDVTGHIKLGGEALTAGVWAPFQRGVNLINDAVTRSGIVVEYVINSYSDAGDEGLFESVPIRHVSDLRFLPELSNSTFGLVYTKFISYICSKAGAGNPYPEILGIVDPNRATNAIINIILLLSNMISD